MVSYRKAVTNEQSESERLSFIVKIWLEETDEASHQAKWRGHITHVGNQDRRYVESLSDICSFIREYLMRIGARPAEVDERKNP
jgi:hypothetical protein